MRKTSGPADFIVKKLIAQGHEFRRQKIPANPVEAEAAEGGYIRALYSPELQEKCTLKTKNTFQHM